MKFEDYRAQDGVGLAGLVAKGEVSAGELLETALARSAEVNPKINAIVNELADFARKETVARTTGPFAGVPFLLKDLTTLLAGVPTTSGSAVFRDAVPAEDSALVAAYKDAGLVIFGKTNTPEFGLLPITEPDLFGPCRNPWNLERTPGGSSGGSAAAVAAGIVPMAQSSDGGGSIRIPAACCGLFGMKPSRGRISYSPNGEGWGGASVVHACTRSVRDSAALLDASCAPQPGDPYFLAKPEVSFAEEARRDPGKLRIGFTAGAILPGSIDPEIAEAVRDVARMLEGLGHTVEEVTVPGDHEAMAAAAGAVMSSSMVATLNIKAEQLGRPIVEGDVEALTMRSYERGQKISGGDYVRALATIHAYGRAVAGLFATYDVLMTSTMGQTAIPVGYLLEDPRQINARLRAFMPNTQAFNNTGQPAMSVPLAWSSDNLPIGIQFVSPIGEEGVLFRLAGQLEQARPWFDRVAPL